MSVSDRDGRPGQPRSAALSRVTEDANLAASLRRLATAGCAMLEHCRGASVTIVTAGHAVTMASTDDVAEALDAAQYDAGDGPCMTAAREERLVRIDAISADMRWPTFRRAAMARGVTSSLSVPMVMEDAEMFGGLNIYGDSAAGFSADEEVVAEGFASEAAIVVTNVVAYWTALERNVNLTAAMEHRGVIEQAKGIVMAANRCSPDEAFSVLRQRSQAENRKLRDIAIDLVNEVQQQRPT